jgi:hypothetical protein
MINMSLKYNVTPKRKELVATAGQYGLFEYTLMFERNLDGENSINIVNQDLLPSGFQPDYIDMQTAQEKSGLSYMKLIELCEKGRLDAKKSNGKWVISLHSLIEYVSK